jgi:hypothetical protein
VSGEADSATTVRARGRTRLDVWVEPARVGRTGVFLATGGFCTRAGGRRTGRDGVGVDCGCTKTGVCAGGGGGGDDDDDDDDDDAGVAGGGGGVGCVVRAGVVFVCRGGSGRVERGTGSGLGDLVVGGAGSGAGPSANAGAESPRAAHPSSITIDACRSDDRSKRVTKSPPGSR